MSKLNTRTPVTKASKQRYVESGFSGTRYDSDSELDLKDRPSNSSLGPGVRKANDRSYQFSQNEDEGRESPDSSFYSGFSSARNKYKNDFRDSGGIENQPVQELENYAVYKAEETTQKVNGCLKIAEEMREDASKTLVTLHQQGQQITRTHQNAVDIEHDLSRSEKLLGSLGGLFSKTWKPKKTRQLKGPMLTRDDSFIQKGSHMEQRQRLGLSAPLPRSNPRPLPSEHTSALDKVEVEKGKQDDALSDLSNILGELKGMAIDMGSEIERQTASLSHMEEDVDEVNFRVRGANMRGRRLLGK
ncbi:SNAP25 homologous protein SNAP32-like [Typha latifolia]|uniref:SNAP25 homologous protein SNAP32-like n=1 Tax=Typha latifolia TaxID=4733 RepID=UPI003C2EA59A